MLIFAEPMGSQPREAAFPHGHGRQGLHVLQGQDRAGVHAGQGDLLPRAGDPGARLVQQQLQKVRQVNQGKSLTVSAVFLLHYLFENIS